MRFYTTQHKFYCGIDLHTNKMYLCVLDQEGVTCLHRNIRTRPETFLRMIEPFLFGSSTFHVDFRISCTGEAKR